MSIFLFWKKKISLILVFFFSFSLVGAADFDSENNSLKLGLGVNNSYVVDEAGVLSLEEENTLRDKIIKIEKETSSEIGILIIKELGEDKSLEEFSVETARKWGIGKKDFDNGVFILVIIDDRLVRIEVGYGLEGALTDLESSRIIRQKIVPEFKKGDYFSGLNKALDTIGLAIVSDEEVLSYKDEIMEKIPTNFNFFNLIFYFFFLFVFIQSNISFFIRYFGKTKGWFEGGLWGGLLATVFAWIFFASITALVVGGIGLLIGLIIDYFISRWYHKTDEKKREEILKELEKKYKSGGGSGGFGGGGFSSGGGGGGFGSFGGGSFGGGGASGKW